MIKYAKISDKRKDEYKIVTTIEENRDGYYIKKRALNSKANIHIQELYKNYLILSNLYGEQAVAKCDLINESTAILEYVEGPTLMERVSMSISRSLWKDVIEELRKYKNTYLSKYKGNSLNLVNPYENGRNSNIDLTLDNIIVTLDGPKIIDYEWLYKDIEPSFVMYRTILGMIEKNNLDFENDNIKEIFRFFKIDNEKINLYKETELFFHDEIFSMLTYHKTEKVIRSIFAANEHLLQDNLILKEQNERLNLQLNNISAEFNNVSIELSKTKQKKWFRIMSKILK